jgi:hypothetical protein
VPDLVFSGRPAGRPAYAPLCERAAPPPGVSPARGPRLAAPLLGPVGPARFSGSPSSSTVAVASFTPLRLRAAPPPGHCPARGPHLAAPRRRRRAPARRARIALTAPSAVLHAALRARGRLGRRDADDARRDHCKGGGRVLRPPWSPPPAGGGRGRGRAPTRQAPCWPGTEGEGSGAVPISLHPGCARCAAPSSQHYASRLG